MKKKLPLLLALTLILMASGARSQATFDFGADLMSRYIWRGIDFGGNSPNIQPWAELNVGNESHNFFVGAWGAYTFSASVNEEIDLYLGYTFKKMVSLTFTDYFFPGLNTGAKNHYFEYGADSTGHVFEGTISFDGTEKIPVKLLFAMNFYGNDARKLNDDGTDAGIAFSKYLEVGYTHNFKSFGINPFIGLALSKPDTAWAPQGYYLNDRIGVINIGVKATKSIPVTEKYSLPVQCSLVANPDENKFYFVFGISF